jgi:hypothetical protein
VAEQSRVIGRIAAAIATSALLATAGFYLTQSLLRLSVAVVRMPSSRWSSAVAETLLARYGVWVAAASVPLVCLAAFYIASRLFPALMGLWAAVVAIPVAFSAQQLARSVAGPLQSLRDYTQGGLTEQLLLLILCGSFTYLLSLSGAVFGALSAHESRHSPSPESP